MSMLAEPRRKQKWSIDPRNSAWTNDDNKFGQKMLERMGWSKGKGLGRSQQGSTEHIKVKVKNNNQGLGTNTNHEDNWIAHQDDFNQLLADLNNCHSQNNGKETPLEQQQSFSLEEKSKTSKKRVHYMKFTKGKDLSCRSKTDLNCIFGKRAKAEPDEEEENNSSDSQREKEEEKVLSAAPPPDVESITKTVTSALSMQEYFAQRMAQLKKGRGRRAEDPASLASTNTGDVSDPAQEGDPGVDCIDLTTDEPEKKKKKKRKKKKSREVAEEVKVADEICTVAEATVNQEHECSEKRKKKRKAAEAEEAVNEGNNGEENPIKKKKKKKNNDNPSTDSPLYKGHGVDEQASQSDSRNKKKKRKGTTQDDDGEVTAEVMVVPERKSKKDKRRNRE